MEKDLFAQKAGGAEGAAKGVCTIRTLFTCRPYKMRSLLKALSACSRHVSKDQKGITHFTRNFRTFGMNQCFTTRICSYLADCRIAESGGMDDLGIGAVSPAQATSLGIKQI